jgi:Peptidase family M28
MNLHETFRMSEQEILDEFLCYAEENRLDYEYVQGQFLWIKGTSNIALMAHIDTVGYQYANMILKEERGVLKGYNGGNRCILGADDRAGVSLLWDFLNMTNQYYHSKIPHIMLFNGEEVGGIGVHKFIDTKPDFTGIELMLSLDCSYHNRFVWYGKTDRYPDAMDYMESYGFMNDGAGIFTDMMIVGNYCNIPCFNLAVGYVNQHTPYEFLDIGSFNMTRKKVEEIILHSPKKFDFIQEDVILDERVLGEQFIEKEDYFMGGYDARSSTYGKFW